MFMTVICVCDKQADLRIQDGSEDALDKHEWATGTVEQFKKKKESIIEEHIRMVYDSILCDYFWRYRQGR